MSHHGIAMPAGKQIYDLRRGAKLRFAKPCPKGYKSSICSATQSFALHTGVDQLQPLGLKEDLYPMPFGVQIEDLFGKANRSDTKQSIEDLFGKANRSDTKQSFVITLCKSEICTGA